MTISAWFRLLGLSLLLSWAAFGVNYSGQLVSKIQPASNGCSDPPAAQGQFVVGTDAAVYLYFYADTTLSDHITNDWLAPDGAVISGGDWNSPVSGHYCYTGEWLTIDSGTPSSKFGQWYARVYDNGAVVFTVPFTLTGPGTIEPRGPSYTGYFDPIATDCSHFTGWAEDGNSPNTIVPVDISVAGFATIQASQSGVFRAGLGNYEWDQYNLQQYEDGQQHQVHVYYHGTTQELPGSPRQFPPSGYSQSTCSGNAPPIGTPSPGTSVWTYSGRTDYRLQGFIVRLEKVNTSGTDYQYNFYLLNDDSSSYSRLTRAMLVMVNRVGTYVYQNSSKTQIAYGGADQILAALPVAWQDPTSVGSSNAAETVLTLAQLLAWSGDPVAAAIGNVAGTITTAQSVASLFGSVSDAWNTMSPSSPLLGMIADQNAYTTRRYYVESTSQNNTNNAPDWGGIKFTIKVNEGSGDQPTFFLLTDNNTFNGILSLEVGANRQSYTPGRLFYIPR